MKKVVLIFALLLLCLPFTIKAAPAQEPVNIYFFYGQGCPHCAAEELFLDQLEQEYGNDIKVYRYETWYNQDNVKLLQEFATAYDLNITGVPVTFVGNQSIIGYDSQGLKANEIKRALGTCLTTDYTCLADEIINSKQNNTNQATEKKGISTVINLPFFGQKDLKEYSLPVLSVVIGILDGFNPCAMWVLIFLITLLLGMQERWKMWLLGSTFIFASAGVYFLFMAAWLNFLMFLGYVSFLKIGIGIFGIISGILFIRDYWKNRNGTCKVVNTEKRKKIFDRLKDIVKKPNIWLALGGIILLAFTVNLVELACSLGFPAIFTQILSLADLPAWQYYGYILLYLLFFLLDDLLVFVIAMTTLKVAGFSGKYTRYSSLIGGILILIIGLILIFKPSWLMFS